MEQDDRLQLSAETVHTLADKDLIGAQSHADILRRLGVIPSVADWRYWFDIALLVLGGAFVVAGVTTFFAFNWDALPKVGKLALVQSTVVVAAAIAFWRGLDDLVGKIALSAASILISAVLIVYGQIYQIDSPAYLFLLSWLLLSLGWVVINRFQPLWLGWFGLLQVTGDAIWEEFFNLQDVLLLLALIALNWAALQIWERVDPVSRFGPRVLFTVTLGIALFQTLSFIFDDFFTPDEPLMPLMAVAFALIVLWALRRYRQRLRDLYPLAACGLSIIVVTVALIVQVNDIDSGMILVVTGVVILLESALLVRWLQRTTLRWEAAP